MKILYAPKVLILIFALQKKSLSEHFSTLICLIIMNMTAIKVIDRKITFIAEY